VGVVFRGHHLSWPPDESGLVESERLKPPCSRGSTTRQKDLKTGQMGNKQKGKGGRAKGRSVVSDQWSVISGRRPVSHILSPSDGERLIWVRAPSLARAIALGNVGERGERSCLSGPGLFSSAPLGFVDRLAGGVSW
jgi:hypothetical protein